MKHRRVWAHRIQLEALCHERNAFVTLTYSPETRPRSVEPRELQLWLKRLRKALDYRIRFYAVGEYGDKSGHPHYHAALFNFGSCQSLTPMFTGEACQCSQCSVVRKTWGFGHVLVGSLTPQSAAYLAGYVTKKALHTVSLSSGQHPEFARMSLRPGIGVDAMWDVASEMIKYRLEVPQGLRHGGFVSPLGRYLRRKLSEFSDVPINKAFVDEKLQLVRAYAFDRSLSVSEVWREMASPAALQSEKRLLSKRREL